MAELTARQRRELRAIEQYKAELAAEEAESEAPKMKRRKVKRAAAQTAQSTPGVDSSVGVDSGAYNQIKNRAKRINAIVDSML